MTPTNDLGILFFGNNGVRTKRVSVLIGNHQLNGAAKIKRVSVPKGRMSTSSTRTFTRSSITTSITSVCDGRPSFRPFCHLFCVVLFKALCSLTTVWSQGQPNQSVCTHDVICVRCDGKGISLRVSFLCHHIFLVLLSEHDPNGRHHVGRRT